MSLTRFITLSALLAATLTAGCAKPPGSIAPVAVSSKDFDHMDCASLAEEINTNAATLEDAERRQRNVVAGDATGVALILIPPSVFTGDASDEVALAKGNDIALRRAFEVKCGEEA